MAPVASTSIRRRRFLLITLLAIVAVVFFFRSSGASWGLPEMLKDSGMSLTRANIVSVIKTKQDQVDEIYGLIHLVTGGDEEHQHVLTNKAEFDPTEPVSLEVYAPGEVDMNWLQEVTRMNEVYPVVVFSKSFCPFSAKAKKLLEKYDLQPPPRIIEVDLRDDSTQIKALLTRLTSRSTFPNILVKGKSIGGSDDLAALHADKTLKKVFEKAGVEVFGEDL